MEELKPLAYNVKFSAVNSLDIFVKKSFKEIVIDSLVKLKKDLSIHVYGYLVMPDNISLIVSTEDAKDIEFFCERFKRTVSQKVMDLLESDAHSDKRWLLFLINFINKDNSEPGTNKIWNLDHNVKEIYNNSQLENKLELLHYTPVLEGIVTKPEEYIFSSAKENVIEKMPLYPNEV